MDKKQIEKQRKEAEEQFNVLQKQKQALQEEITERQNKINEIDAECLRLSGAYQALGKLLDKPKKADTIDVSDVEGA